jgi:hypothetical protein
MCEVGATLTGGPLPQPDQVAMLAGLRAQISTLWLMNSGVAANARLRYLYTKRQAIETLEGQVRSKIDFTLGPLSPKQSQFFANLKTMYDQALAEIVRQEKLARVGRAPAIGQIYRQSPRMPVIEAPTPAGVNPPPEIVGPDPNDVRYTPGPLEGGNGFVPR